MKLDVGNFGNLGEKEFDHIYCSICTNDILPSLLHTHRGKLRANATIKDLLGKWDILDIQLSYLDMAGCLIPHEGHVHARPNARRFIERPTEHTSVHNAKIKTTKKGSSSSSTSDGEIIISGDKGNQENRKIS